MKKAVQFGAGNIGRGFLGQLFYESGYETTFIDVMDDVVKGLNERGSYPLRIVGDTVEQLQIGNARAVHGSNVEAAAEAIAEADFGATAVGVPILPRIAATLARGIEKRFSRADAEPLNLVICENMIDAGPFLREEVRKHLPLPYHAALEKKVGFVEASIGRMVPVMTAELRAEDPLLVCVEPYCELPVAKAMFRGTIPELRHMKPLDNFAAYVERKLFVHNMSHAVAAYLGHLRNHEYIWQAVEDPTIRPLVEAAMNETCEGLARKHGMDRDALTAHADDLLHRYSNKALADQVARIGKDPIRKLGPRDRLIGAGLMCLEQGIRPENVALGTAAALHFQRADDPASLSIQDMLQEHGIHHVFSAVCGIEPGSALAGLIKEKEWLLADEGWLHLQD